MKERKMNNNDKDIQKLPFFPVLQAEEELADTASNIATSCHVQRQGSGTKLVPQTPTKDIQFMFCW